MRGDPRPIPPELRRIQQERDRILQLIAKLSGNDLRSRSAVPRLPGAQPRPQPRPESRLPVRTPARSPREARQATAQAATKLTAPNESSLQLQDLQVRLQNIELRLNRMEERLDARVSRVPVQGTEKLPDPTFSGVVQGQMLSDMLQLVSSNGLTGKFAVENDHCRSVLFFEEGNIYHAEAPGMTGEEAFFMAFGVENGTYAFWETTDLPSEKTVTGSTQFLILEALRQIDESSA